MQTVSARPEAKTVQTRLADPATFAQDVTPYLDGLKGYALSLTRHSADSEDLVQDTLIRAYRSYDQFQTGTNLSAWLRTIMRNQFINQYRKQQRRPAQVTIDDPDHPISLPADSPGPFDTVYGATIEDTIKALVEGLPEQFRSVLLLREFEGFRYYELAEVLQVPVGTVMSRLYRARRLLRKMLLEVI